MARPREFDRDQALQDAMKVFWTKGFAATSTDDLREAMGIGRQSLYNAFGDKRQIYLETLSVYLQGVTGGHLARLNGPASALDGIRDLLVGLASEDEGLRSLGCMGVCSIGEFGATDTDVAELREKASRAVALRLADRIREGQAAGQIDPTVDPSGATGFIQMAMNGLQVAARAGTGAADLAALAGFIVDRLKVH